MRRLALALTLVLTATCRTAPQVSGTGWGPGTSAHRVDVDGDGRSFLLHVPPAPPRRIIALPAPYPLLLVLHGSSADGAAIRDQSRMDAVADSFHVIVAYPNGSRGLLGIGSDWNAGTCCGAAARNGVGDVEFLETLIDSIAMQLPVDRHRIYVAGFSDGARMAYHFACARAGRVAAIGAVSGSLVDDDCEPTRPVPLIAFHGTADDQVAFDEPTKTASGRSAPPSDTPVPPVVAFWSALNHCQSGTTQRVAPRVLRTTYRRCEGDVVFYTIEGGTHAWPGNPGDDAAAPSREVNGSSLMIRFLLRHRAP